MSHPQNQDETNNNPAALALADEDEDDISDDNDNNNRHEDTSDSDVTDDEDDDPLQHLPPYVCWRVDKLRELQESHESLMKDYLRERAALEKKYEALVKPLYQERSAVVRGDRDEAIAEKNQSLYADRVQGIPQFFATAMSHNDAIAELICEDDVDCLEHLVDIACVDRDDGLGFTLSFHFTPNVYFTNDVLTKSYVVPNLLSSDEPMLKSIEGTTINWKPGRALTYHMVQKKQRGKGKNAGKVRTVAVQEEKESFFLWFKAPEIPILPATMDEEEVEKAEQLCEDDFEVACAFRSHIIPKAYSWFTGRVSFEISKLVQG